MPEETRGRPPLPPSERRVQINTTIPRPIEEAIREKRWKFNEVLLDGFVHRVNCADEIELFERTISRMQAKIDFLEKEHQLLKVGNSTERDGSATEE